MPSHAKAAPCRKRSRLVPGKAACRVQPRQRMKCFCPRLYPGMGQKPNQFPLTYCRPANARELPSSGGDFGASIRPRLLIRLPRLRIGRLRSRARTALSRLGLRGFGRRSPLHRPRRHIILIDRNVEARTAETPPQHQSCPPVPEPATASASRPSPPGSGRSWQCRSWPRSDAGLQFRLRQQRHSRWSPSRRFWYSTVLTAELLPEACETPRHGCEPDRQETPQSTAGNSGDSLADFRSR